MATIILKTDLPTAVQAAELVDLMVAGANADATRVAPCLAWTGDADSDTPAPTEDQLSSAKLVLAGAIIRWTEAGSGALQSQTAGPFGVTVDTRQKSSGYKFWPSDITQLQDICGGSEGSDAFSVDTLGCGTIHSEICALAFGALYCSCAADIAGFPLYEDTF